MKVSSATGVIASILMAFVCEVGFATVQVHDRFCHDGVKRCVLERPLEHVWWDKGLERPSFDEASTANRWGYWATWEIRDSKLYLVSFKARVQGRRIPVHKILSGRKLPVHADWYTGKLHVPLGDWIIESGHLNPTYERLLVLEVKKGSRRFVDPETQRRPGACGREEV